MSYFESILLNPNSVSLDAGSRLRVSQLTTLMDGKILNSDNPFIWDNQGTGTGLYAANKYNMSVTAGQFFVRQSKRFSPYYAGKSQIIECTFDNFQVEANVVKRVGYFSSNAVSPFASTYDGFYLENNGTTIKLKAERAGVTTIDVDWTNWDNYDLISGYDWSTFTVIAFDFLWLGGAQLRIFLKTDLGFVLAHTVAYSGTATDVFILSPNQPIRYEIRSTTGTGSIRYICSQVSTEGSINEAGYNNSVNSFLPSNTVATVGTTYPLKAIRKKVANRNNSVKLTGATIFVSSASDILLWSIQLNPILSAPLTFVDIPNSAIQEANGSAVAAISTTVITKGRTLSSGIISQNGVVPSGGFSEDFLQFLGCSLNNTMDELVLCVTPISATITVNGTLNFKEY
jgi:hypothetical protein